jgi:cyclophilin family peptidyl-prolyl cis-trans isomerase
VTPEHRARVRQILVEALTRTSDERRETSRDPRMAMLARLGEIGPAEEGSSGETLIAALRARLADFDPVVASQTAAVLTAWTNTPHEAAPQPLPRAPLDLARVAPGRRFDLRVQMRDRGAFTMRLRVDEAPLSALRVLTLVDQDSYNGLTFHRVAPNFVVQGGSPGANEYMGDGPFMRDEVGLASHVRGTVGISTRGRDTGDAQIFVNLVDSVRLDHAYTVLADVIDGMDVVDRIVEGDTIERVVLVTPTP